MNKWHLLSLALLPIGLVFLVQGIIIGDIELGIAFIIPFMMGSGIFAGVAFLCITGAFVCFFLGTLHTIDKQEHVIVPPKEKKSSIKTGGVVFIGPLPVIFGSNWKIAVVLMILALILIVVMSVLMPTLQH